MAPFSFERWTSRVGEALPFHNLQGWRYAPVEPSTNGSNEKRQPSHFLRDCVRSKTVWLTVAAILVIALLADFFHPARNVLENHGLLRPDGKVNEAAECSATGGVDWSQYAYCQYVTNAAYLCNSLMIFESLTRLGAKASKVMMYPQDWRIDDLDSDDDRRMLLLKAKNEYNVSLVPVEVQHFSNEGDQTWAESFTKLLAFNQTQYKRVLSLDSDATVLQPLDELFLLPSAPVAMPRAYWLHEKPVLSSQLVLIEPSEAEFNRIQKKFANHSESDFDMEIANDLYANDCFVIPHRKYDLVTGEFRGRDHHYYLGSDEEVWDPDKALKEAKFLHFSDWPVPKPWLAHEEELFEEKAPKCRALGDGAQDCRDREKWMWAYKDFLDRRQKVCGSSFMPLPLGESKDKRSALRPPSKWEFVP